MLTELYLTSMELNPHLYVLEYVLSVILCLLSREHLMINCFRSIVNMLLRSLVNYITIFFVKLRKHGKSNIDVLYYYIKSLIS